jgi:hypothetical protein
VAFLPQQIHHLAVDSNRLLLASIAQPLDDVGHVALEQQRIRFAACDERGEDLSSI